MFTHENYIIEGWFIYLVVSEAIILGLRIIFMLSVMMVGVIPGGKDFQKNPKITYVAWADSLHNIGIGIGVFGSFIANGWSILNHILFFNRHSTFLVLPIIYFFSSMVNFGIMKIFEKLTKKEENEENEETNRGRNYLILYAELLGFYVGVVSMGQLLMGSIYPVALKTNNTELVYIMLSRKCFACYSPIYPWVSFTIYIILYFIPYIIIIIIIPKLKAESEKGKNIVIQ